MEHPATVSLNTPIGPLTLYAVGGCLAAIDFSESPKEETLVYLEKRLSADLQSSSDISVLVKASEQLSDYFAGKRKDFDLPLLYRTTPFQTLVLEELCRIPYGGVTSYSDIALKIGFPKAFRAVGNANNKNPLPIIIPCHRVNARDGMLSGYAGGISVKRKLQEIEANAVLLENSTEIISTNEILNPELSAFIRSFTRPSDERLSAIEKEGYNRNIPISKPETLALLNSMIASKPEAQVLEIGTAIGFSAISMALSNPSCTVTTIERDEAYAENARQNIASFALENKIALMRGDALALLQTMEKRFDVIFIDAAKGQYGKLYDLSRGLLKPNGILVFDNVLYKGITSGLQVVKHKNRTMVRALQSFLATAKNDQSFSPALVPTGDGVLIMVKKGE